MPIDNFLNQILCGEALSLLKQLPDDSVDCVVTSPPYWSLRDYRVNGQLGLETDFHDYLGRLISVFDEVYRLLKPAGTCWVNLGDTYFTHKGAGGAFANRPRQAGKYTLADRAFSGATPKSLCQLPARFAIAMTERGWILRNELIWHKPNGMPESVKDRFTVDFEKLFFFVKSRHYYFEQQFEPLTDAARLSHRFINPSSLKKRPAGDAFISAINPKTAEASRRRILKKGRNKRSVWRIATRPSSLAHFAVYPPQLIETPIKAGCPPGGVVLDPFIGSGTTALVARKLGRRSIGMDINPNYVRLARQRLSAATR